MADLVAMPGKCPGETHSDFDSLMRLISTIVAPTTWDQVGGAGAIARQVPTGTITVRQTREVHEEIESLLRSLRAARDKQGIPLPKAIGPDWNPVSVPNKLGEGMHGGSFP